MQATLDARGLKPFTKALACVAKYGDEMLIHSKLDCLVLTSMNHAKSAFCSFTFNRAFFQKYTVQLDDSQNNTAGPSRSNIRNKNNVESEVLRSQLQTKALLAVLRHRNNERSVEKCDILVVEGCQAGEEARENEDSFESRLVVRLHCKHGIVKTHRLLLNTPTYDEAPNAPDSEFESRLTVQPGAIRDIFEHFPNARGPKSDPELIWRFDVDEVSVKSLEKGIDTKGKSQLASEMFVPADDFEMYNMYFSPITIGFFLREFNATVVLADSLNIPLEMRFTLPAEPMYITAETEECSMLFVIATNITRAEDDDPAIKQLRSGTYQHGSANANARKRALEDDAANGRMGNGSRRSSKVVRRLDSRASSRQDAGTQQSRNGNSQASSGPRSGTRQPTASTPSSATLGDDGDTGQQQEELPLFLSSQLSVADIEVLQQSGLGVETMTADEFAAMLDGEGEEVNDDILMKPPSKAPGPSSARPSTKSGVSTNGEWEECDELDDDDMVMGPTQSEGSADKEFRPLFED